MEPISHSIFSQINIFCSVYLGMNFYLPTIWIMKEAKTTTQPQPPSGGVGRASSSRSSSFSCPSSTCHWSEILANQSQLIQVLFLLLPILHLPLVTNISQSEPAYPDPLPSPAHPPPAIGKKQLANQSQLIQILFLLLTILHLPLVRNN